MPERGVPFIDTQTGLRVTRLTDVNDIVPIPGLNPGLPWEIDGNPAEGFTNGYSRWTNINVTGEYALAFRTVTAVPMLLFSAHLPASGPSEALPGFILGSRATGRFREITMAMGAGRLRYLDRSPDSGLLGGLPGHISGRSGIGLPPGIMMATVPLISRSIGHPRAYGRLQG